MIDHKVIRDMQEQIRHLQGQQRALERQVARLDQDLAIHDYSPELQRSIIENRNREKIR